MLSLEIPKPGFLPDLNPNRECCLQAADEGEGAGTENHLSKSLSDCTAPAPLCLLAHVCLSVILPVGVGREDKTLENWSKMGTRGTQERWVQEGWWDGRTQL